ncbi:MAG: hypothetical protein IPM82_20960 [Saprospiraceae bacterium]|nr:hypothetical protein [Saprospiraceae bacterium]
MKKMLPVFALFLLPSLAFSCSCLYGLSFCELITPSSNVANVRIINTYVVATQFSEVLWLDVVVEEALQGSIEHDTMSILASYGTSCDPDFSAFHAGDNLVVQVDEELTDGPTDWYKFEFDNACKQSFLSLKMTPSADSSWTNTRCSLTVSSKAPWAPVPILRIPLIRRNWSVSSILCRCPLPPKQLFTPMCRLTTN